MSEFEYITATDFDRAWLNFELDLPLKPGPNGEPNPFYINRPGNPIAELIDALLAPFYRPPKFFFSGHRGCGKSTELLHLMANPGIQKKYWPMNFSIREEADIIDLDFRDILLAIGSRMFRDYRKAGGSLPEQLLKELNGWRGKVEEEVKTIHTGRTAFEIGAGIDAFFTNTGLKMKLEPATRAELRQVFEKDITGLISVINNIATAIYSKEHRIPLILIDDLDKPNLEEARAIFHDRRNIMMQPELRHHLYRFQRVILQQGIRSHPGPGHLPAKHQIASACRTGSKGQGRIIRPCAVLCMSGSIPTCRWPGPRRSHLEQRRRVPGNGPHHAHRHRSCQASQGSQG